MRRFINLFQYGSNMNPERLNGADRLNGAAETVGVAELRGWGIRFDLYGELAQGGVTDIVSSPKEHVEGILYRVLRRVRNCAAPLRLRLRREGEYATRAH